MRRLLDFAAGAASGILAGLAFPPYDLAPLVFVCLVPALARVRATGGRRTGWVFLGFGLLYFSIGLAWIRTVLTLLGPVGLGLVLTLLFVWPLGLVLGWLVRRGWSLLLAAPAALLVSDWLRTWVLTGFPWLYLAHPLAGWGTLIQVSDVLGAWGVTALVVLANAAITEAIFRGREGAGRRALLPLAAPAAVLVAFLVYGVVRPSTIEIEEGPAVLLVQGNIPQFEKREGWKEASSASGILEIHTRLTLEGIQAHPEVEVIVWPETMFSYMIPDADELEAPPDGGEAPRVVPKFRRLSELAGRRPLIVGALSRTTADDEEERRNSVFLVLPGGGVGGRHDKRRIVPGGEFVPLRDILPARATAFVGELIENASGVSPNLVEGEEVVLLEAAGVKFAPLVCYETCYPALCREAVNAGADVLLNVSNYGWFPETSEPEQALQYGIFRAVEVRRPLAVAANTGISGIVDPLGRVQPLVVDGKRKDVAGTFAGALPLTRAGSVYARIGDVLPLASLFAFLAALLRAMISRGRARVRADVP